jgi:preprotein translocase subunit YajC
MIQIGDKVSAIDDDVNGIVIAIQGETIIIETEDGFEMRFQKKELIVINPDQIKTLLQSSRVQQSIINEKEISKRKPVIKEKKSLIMIF